MSYQDLKKNLEESLLEFLKGCLLPVYRILKGHNKDLFLFYLFMGSHNNTAQINGCKNRNEKKYKNLAGYLKH